MVCLHAGLLFVFRKKGRNAEECQTEMLIAAILFNPKVFILNYLCYLCGEF